MLHFAYDGSIHGDWVARYAMRMATRLPEPRLQVLHIRDGQRSDSVLEKGLAANRIRMRIAVGAV